LNWTAPRLCSILPRTRHGSAASSGGPWGRPFAPPLSLPPLSRKFSHLFVVRHFSSAQAVSVIQNHHGYVSRGVHAIATFFCPAKEFFCGAERGMFTPWLIHSRLPLRGHASQGGRLFLGAGVRWIITGTAALHLSFSDVVAHNTVNRGLRLPVVLFVRSIPRLLRRFSIHVGV